jgi:hypothetical protein
MGRDMSISEIFNRARTEATQGFPNLLDNVAIAAIAAIAVASLSLFAGLPMSWQLAVVTVTGGILGPIIYYAWLWARAFVRACFESRAALKGQMGQSFLCQSA